MVPNNKFPFFAIALAPFTLSKIHFIFDAEKYGSSKSPVFSLIFFSFPSFFS